MKRKGSKIVMALLTTATLISSNVGAVYATESATTTTTADVTETDTTTDTTNKTEATETTTDTTNKAETDTTTDTTNKTETTEKSEATETTNKTETTEKFDTTETVTDAVNKTETTEKSDTTETVTDAVNKTETTEKSDTTETTTDTTNKADTTETTTETSTETVVTDEQVFINKNGEEVAPSSLLGVDYNTISDNYDGETNVLKQFVESDAAADTVVDSYIDENGNLVMIISQGAAIEKEPVKEETNIIASLFGLDATSGSSSSAPAVDGSVDEDNGRFVGWDDVPVSYEYNWNKQDAWVDGVHYTETNSTDVRHAMQMYTDGENVYLNITFSREYGATGTYANGNDYQFYVDGEMAAYQVKWKDGSNLEASKVEPGIYEVDIRHRNTALSWSVVDGAVAYYNVTPDNINNQLELKLPLSELQKQNGAINLDNFSMIQFFTPNLMLDRISAAGSPTGSVPFAAAVFLLVPASYVLLKKKNEGEMVLA